MADLRRCIGSPRFGIEPHNAPVDDFPSQPSQKDGLGRMCRPHWNVYTAQLARDAKARKAAAEPATIGAAIAQGGDLGGADDSPPVASDRKRARRPTPPSGPTSDGDAA